MKRFPAVLFATLAFATSNAIAQSVPAIRFDATVDFLKLPTDLYLGEVAGVAVNSKGHVFIYSRTGERSTVHGATAAQLFEFGPDGTFIREIGKNLYGFAFAHVVRVDRDDNIWVVDEGTNMIMKFNPTGRITMVLGRKEEAGEPAPARPANAPPPPAGWGSFNRPTDVTWDPQGNIFISDGYGNSRVVKVDKNGRWVKTWGERGSGPGQFNTPHSIAADAKGNIYVADRGNRRIQVFDGEGTLLRQFTIDVPFAGEPNVMLGSMPGTPGGGATMASGAPWAVCITPGATQYLYVADAVPGRIYKVTLDGKVLGTIGEAGKELKQFGWIHEIACPSQNSLYVAELLNWRMQKLTLLP
ncbi:MAG: peptidyl-alpha-hydroxyglycine alpha-amidating lyase family protein [Gemmatimonadaceae bacterium]